MPADRAEQRARALIPMLGDAFCKWSEKIDGCAACTLVMQRIAQVIREETAEIAAELATARAHHTESEASRKRLLAREIVLTANLGAREIEIARLRAEIETVREERDGWHASVAHIGQALVMDEPGDWRDVRADAVIACVTDTLQRLRDLEGVADDLDEARAEAGRLRARAEHARGAIEGGTTCGVCGGGLHPQDDGYEP